MQLKKILLSLLVIAAFAACTPSAGDAVGIYNDGVEKVRSAKSDKELEEISKDVAKKITNWANRPGGDQKMSPEDTEKVISARNRFQQATMQRSRELAN